MKVEQYKALLQMYEDVAGQFEEGASPAMWVLPLGSLREIVGKYFELEQLGPEVRELVLNLELGDTEIVVVTPGHAGLLGRETE